LETEIVSAPPTNELISIGAAVEQLRARYPEVTHSSLRFLERQGLLSSTRTAGGHRLYARADLDRVALIKSWQRDGHSLEEIRQLLEERSRLRDPARLSREFLELGLASQSEQASQLILQADRLGFEPEVLFFDVMQPALVRLGLMWADGTATVRQEKEISVLCRELVAEITLRHAPDFPTGSLFVSACAPGERHEIGICMVNGILRQRGHRVRYLGPDVATVFLVDAVTSCQPEAVLLSCSVEHSFTGCLDAVQAVDERWKGERPPLIIVGGEMASRGAQELVELGAVPVRDVRTMLRFDELLSPA
jgi:DNA-binding transcriptional MerR regulator/methylmalonyl-CoA mutase cobalamin-binding subunit